MSNTYFDPLISRICQAARDRLRNNGDGLAIVTVKILMDANNKPVLWSVPDCIRLEPASRVVTFLDAMSGE